jgi:hypothetical protein
MWVVDTKCERMTTPVFLLTTVLLGSGHDLDATGLSKLGLSFE